MVGICSYENILRDFGPVPVTDAARDWRHACGGVKKLAIDGQEAREILKGFFGSLRFPVKGIPDMDRNDEF
jgi:hypothetical protein